MPHSGRNFRKPIDIDGDGIGDHGAWMRPDGFIEMYNDKLYEDYDFLQKHCSPELLQKLQDAYPYDSEAPAYATWLSEAGSRTALRAIKDKCYREISIELYGNDHDIIGNREIVRYL